MQIGTCLHNDNYTVTNDAIRGVTVDNAAASKRTSALGTYT